MGQIRQRLIFVALAGYFCLLLAMSGLRPFWLDEVLQLTGTIRLSGRPLATFVRSFPGAAPLGYFIQHTAIAAAGFSPLSARITSEVSSVIACVAMVLLGRQLKLRHSWALAAIWILLPLQLRYALEARPYSLALLFSAVSTLSFFRLLEKPTGPRTVAYFVAVACGVYTVPYTAFLQAGLVLALLLTRGLARETLWSGLAAGFAGASFLPWYFASQAFWKASLAPLLSTPPAVSPRLLLVILREISGGGYLCSLLLAGFALVALGQSLLSRETKILLSCAIASGLAGAIGMDVAFGYFYAVRQILFVLIPLTALAAAGVAGTRRPIAMPLAVLFLAAAAVKDVSYFSDRSEDWAATASQLLRTTKAGGCVDYADPGAAQAFELFEPQLAGRVCGVGGASLKAVVTSSYDDPSLVRGLLLRLAGEGWTPVPPNRIPATAAKIQIMVLERK